MPKGHHHGDLACIHHNFTHAKALATVLALQENLLPANNGVTEIDPAINLDVILGQPRKADPKLVLSNSLAFGGLNAVLALRPAP